MLPNEYVFHGKRDINYLFHRGAKSSPFLLVSFQAVPAVKDGKPVKLYNYKKFLKEANLHRLFIEDTCGDFGCYYLCNNMNFDVEETVIQLIESVMKKLKIKKENVITFGSSKGGTSALYYGLKYNFGHIIAGAPQTKIATYLNKYRPEMLEYMIGDFSQEKVDYVDCLVLNQVKSPCSSEITMLTSKSDAQYEPHIIPLLEAFERENIDATVVYEPRVQKHKDIATYFPDFLEQHIQRIIHKKYKLTHPSFERTSNSLSLVEPKHSVKINTKIKILSPKGEIVEQASLASGDYFEFKTDDLLSFSAVHTVCIGEEPIYSTTLCDSMFDQGYFDYKGYSMIFNNETKELEFKLDIDPKHPISYAFSLVKGRDTVIPIYASDEPETKFPITESGTYIVRFAIKVKGKGVLRKNSNRFPIAVE